MIKKYLPVAIGQRLDGLDARVGRITHGVSESTGAKTPVGVWKVTVPKRIDIAGTERLEFGKNFLLVSDLGFRINRRGDAASEK